MALFDGTSSKDCVIDVDVEVGVIEVKFEYSGTITQAAGVSVTVNCEWKQDGGTFQGSDGAVAVMGPLTVKGGAFLAGSGVMAVSGELKVEEWGAFDAETRVLDAAGPLTVLGGVFGAGSSAVTVSGVFKQDSGGVDLGAADILLESHLVLAGGDLAAGSSFVRFIGDEDQDADFTMTPAFAWVAVEKTGGVVRFVKQGFSADRMSIAAGSTVEFTPDEPIVISELDWKGEPGAPVTVRSLDPGVAWTLVVPPEQWVRHVDVRESDAAQGAQVTAYNSIDSDGNTDWVFLEDYDPPDPPMLPPDQPSEITVPVGQETVTIRVELPPDAVEVFVDADPPLYVVEIKPGESPWVVIIGGLGFLAPGQSAGVTMGAVDMGGNLSSLISLLLSVVPADPLPTITFLVPHRFASGHLVDSLGWQALVVGPDDIDLVGKGDSDLNHRKKRNVLGKSTQWEIRIESPTPVLRATICEMAVNQAEETPPLPPTPWHYLNMPLDAHPWPGALPAIPNGAGDSLGLTAGVKQIPSRVAGLLEGEYWVVVEVENEQGVSRAGGLVYVDNTKPVLQDMQGPFPRGLRGDPDVVGAIVGEPAALTELVGDADRTEFGMPSGWMGFPDLPFEGTRDEWLDGREFHYLAVDYAGNATDTTVEGELLQAYAMVAPGRFEGTVYVYPDGGQTTQTYRFGYLDWFLEYLELVGDMYEYTLGKYPEDEEQIGDGPTWQRYKMQGNLQGILVDGVTAPSGAGLLPQFPTYPPENWQPMDVKVSLAGDFPYFYSQDQRWIGYEGEDRAVIMVGNRRDPVSFAQPGSAGGRLGLVQIGPVPNMGAEVDRLGTTDAAERITLDGHWGGVPRAGGKAPHWFHAGWQPPHVELTTFYGEVYYTSPSEEYSTDPERRGVHVYYAKPGIMNIVRAGPSVAAVGTTVTVRIVGGGFTAAEAAGSKVWLIKDGNVVAESGAGGNPRVVEFDLANAKRYRALEVDIDLPENAPLGAYDVAVKVGDVAVDMVNSNIPPGRDEQWTWPTADPDTRALLIKGAMRVVRLVSLDVSASDPISEKFTVDGKDNLVGLQDNGGMTLYANVTPYSPLLGETLSWEADRMIVSTSAGGRVATLNEPTDEPVKSPVRFRVGGTTCWEGTAWLMWADLKIKTKSTQTLDPDNGADAVANGQWPATDGGGNKLGPINKETHTGMIHRYAAGRMEAVATLKPEGIEDIVPKERWHMRRSVTAVAWDNGGRYEEGEWYTGPSADFTDKDDTSSKLSRDLDPTTKEDKKGKGKLFDLDAPGCSLKRGINIIHTSECYDNFLQWVGVELQEFPRECSDKKQWYYWARVDMDKAGSKVEANDVGEGHVNVDAMKALGPYYKKR